LLAEIVDATEVHGEIGGEGNVITIHTELDVVCAFCPGKIVGQLVALLHAIYEGKGFTSEEREARNIDRHIVAAGGSGETVE